MTKQISKSSLLFIHLFHAHLSWHEQQHFLKEAHTLTHSQQNIAILSKIWNLTFIEFLQVPGAGWTIRWLDFYSSLSITATLKQ